VLKIAESMDVTSNTEYIIGAIIALLLIVYLLYALIKPEKF